MDQQAKKLVRLSRRRYQRGQALLYGLFMMMAASAAIYFMFYTGNLANEKTKLVNTADAVAYSAGVMHARALNFDASINRAMVANEALVAQLVSVASWLQYTKAHSKKAPLLNCASLYSIPAALVLLKYAPVCAEAALLFDLNITEQIETFVDETAGGLMASTAIVQSELQAAQVNMLASLSEPNGHGGMRAKVMQEVADANFAGDGTVLVDAQPLDDGFFFFDGGTLIAPYIGEDRDRFKIVAVDAARKDAFVKERKWSDASPWPCELLPRGEFKRRSWTGMVGLDEWKAIDTGSLHLKHFSFTGCKSEEIPMGFGTQSAADEPSSANSNFEDANDNPIATGLAKGSNWKYNGLPKFFELSKRALEYGSANTDPAKKELRVIFSIRVTRNKNQTKTPDGTTAVRPSGRLAVFEGAEKNNILAAVSTSEVYFERPADAPRADGNLELASLFNPYWQVRLRATPPETLAFARTLGGPK